MKCIVPNCIGNSSNTISFHQIPANLERRSIWIHNLGLKPEIIGDFTSVCDRHFTENDFLPESKQRKLKRNTVPRPVIQYFEVEQEIPLSMIATYKSSETKEVDPLALDSKVGKKNDKDVDTFLEYMRRQLIIMSNIESYVELKCDLVGVLRKYAKQMKNKDNNQNRLQNKANIKSNVKIIEYDHCDTIAIEHNYCKPLYILGDL